MAPRAATCDLAWATLRLISLRLLGARQLAAFWALPLCRQVQPVLPTCRHLTTCMIMASGVCGASVAVLHQRCCRARLDRCARNYIGVDLPDYEPDLVDAILAAHAESYVHGWRSPCKGSSGVRPATLPSDSCLSTSSYSDRLIVDPSGRLIVDPSSRAGA